MDQILHYSYGSFIKYKSHLNKILSQRNILLKGTDEEIISALIEYDKIDQSWLRNIYDTQITDLGRLSVIELYVYCEIHNLITFNYVINLSEQEIENLISILVLRRDSLSSLTEFIKDNTITRKILETILLYFGNTLKIISVLTVPEMKLIVCNMLKIKNIKGIGQRITRKRLIESSKRKSLILRLYGLWDEDICYIFIFPIHPMENILLYLDTYKEKDIINTFGMVIFNKDKSQYILDNIVDYRYILSRNSLNIKPEEIIKRKGYQLIYKLNLLKDTEIFDIFGLCVYHESRLELIERTASAQERPTLMIPLIRDRNKCTNHNYQTYINLTPIEDTKTKMIAYGTLSSYALFELDELIEGCYKDKDDINIKLRYPNNPTNYFNETELVLLKNLITYFPPCEETLTLSQKIQEILDSEKESEVDKVIINMFMSLDEKDKDKLYQALILLFETGMYMRTWKGPGFPYPLKEQDTRQGDPAEAVSKHLILVSNLMKEMSPEAEHLLLSLPMCFYNQREIEITNRNLLESWEAIIKSKACIRMISIKLIGTAYHYLFILYRYKIPNLNVKEIDSIY